MALKKLKPQNEDRVDWEISVTNALCERLDCSYSDASGILGAHADLIDRLYTAGTTPADAAVQLDAVDAA